MEEMVEPDRTIMIVSIIGLVIIWGSVLYHKFVQGGRKPPAPDPVSVQPETPEQTMPDPERDKGGGQKPKNRKQKKKR